jgi:hypothetical protein
MPRTKNLQIFYCLVSNLAKKFSLCISRWHKSMKILHMSAKNRTTLKKTKDPLCLSKMGSIKPKKTISRSCPFKLLWKFRINTVLVTTTVGS